MTPTGKTREIVAPRVPDELADPTSPSSFSAKTWWLPPLALGSFVVVSLTRTGVELVDIVRFTSYWIVALLLPGLIVARLLLGPQKTMVEDLAVSAVTGLSLEVLCWSVGVSLGIGSIVRFWWLPVIVLGAALPAWRQRALVRVAERVAFGHSAALSAVATSILIRLDVSSFRSAPLPPQGGALFHDLWWQLSLVQELMRFERPQVPQVAGEPLNYHFFANIHIAIGSRLSGVAPEVVLLRLWVVPVVLLSIGLAVTLGRLLTTSLAGGIATAWLAFGVSLRTYIWVDVTGFAVNPIMFHSPSQILANVGMLSTAIGFVLLLRRGLSASLAGWLVLVVIGASGTKSTVVPILICATLTALIWATLTRSKHVRTLVGATIGLLILHGSIIALASGTSGGKLVVLGTLKNLAVYKDLVAVEAVRGVNDGLLLDSIDSPRNAAFALLALVVVLGMHAYRLAGLLILTRRDGRSDPVNWWLSGAVVAGFTATFMIDHIGSSQSFFALSVVPLGAALTVSALWHFTTGQAVSKRSHLIDGVAAGCAVTLFLDYFVRARQRAGGYGALDRIVFPMLLLAVLAMLAAWWWRQVRPWKGSVLALLLACVVGILMPSEIELTARSTYRWAGPVAYPSSVDKPDYLSSGELEAMTWLRSNSDSSDVIVTNVHCRPVQPQAFCDARGFWVVGLSGRRAVLEGWGYTSEAQELQGVGGRVYARQPSPFVERAELNDAVFSTSDLDALHQLADGFGARWIVAVHRASEVPSFPEAVATVRFDNGEVTILEIIE